MLFAIDIGNTNTSLGVFDGENLIEHWRIVTKSQRTFDELGGMIVQLFSFSKIDRRNVSAIIVSSVVPPLNSTFQTMSEKYFGQAATFVDSTFDFRLKIKYDPPSSIGVDRVIVAAAAVEKCGAPCIVADFGTATTIDVINSKKEFLGGVIAPGMRTMSEALFLKTSKLPRIEIQKPASVIGNSTRKAIESGIYFGYIGLVDGIVRRMTAELGEAPKIIATGGFARLIAETSETIEMVDDDLMLDGLRLVYENNLRRSSGRNTNF